MFIIPLSWWCCVASALPKFLSISYYMYVHVLLYLSVVLCLPSLGASGQLILFSAGAIVSVGDPTKKYTKMEKIGQG